MLSARVFGRLSVPRLNLGRFYATVPLAYDKWEPKEASKTAKPIVFLHGLFGNKLNNRTAAKSFARDLKTTVYCLDLRNHGDSPAAEPHTYKAMAGDVKQFILDHKLADPTVIGHSMGAKTAMELALGDPDLVGVCIPVDNAPISLRLHSDFGKFIQGMMTVQRAKCTQSKDMYSTIAPFCPELPIQQFLLSNFNRNPETGFYECRLPLEILAKSLGNVGDFADFDGTDKRFLGPTLFIRGTKSPFVPDEAFPRMGELFPRFVCRDIDSGHLVISEKPKEFIEEVERFLSEDD